MCHYFLITLQLSIPRLLPATKPVRELWNALFMSLVKLSAIAIPGVIAYEWLCVDILEYICGNAFLLDLFETPVDTLEVIIKLDAFPVGNNYYWLLESLN